MNKKYISTFGFILILLPSLAAQACGFNASMIENWSDKTVCRLLQENHANCSTLIDSELTSREITCGIKGPNKKTKQTISDHSLPAIQTVDPRIKKTPPPANTLQRDNATAKKTPPPTNTLQRDNATAKIVKQQRATGPTETKVSNKNTKTTYTSGDVYLWIVFGLAIIAFALLLKVRRHIFKAYVLLAPLIKTIIYIPGYIFQYVMSLPFIFYGLNKSELKEGGRWMFTESVFWFITILIWALLLIIPYTLLGLM
jgi:hypothetical protein